MIMPMETRFRAAHPRPRGDNPQVDKAYWVNPKPQTGCFVTTQNLDSHTMAGATSANMKESAAQATAFLKALAHEGRLMILCHLGEGERSVSELEALLEMRQAAVSQMLARLREEGLVKARREGKTIYYALKDAKTARVIELLYDLFCKPGG